MSEFVLCVLSSTIVLTVAAFYSVRKFDVPSLLHRMAMVLFPASQLAAALFLFAAIQRAGLGVALAFVVAFVCVCCAAADAALCRAIAEAGRRSIDAEQLRLLEKQERIESGYRTELSIMGERTNTARNDLLQDVEALIRRLEEGQSAGVGEMVGKTAQAIVNSGMPVCENKALDALLDIKLAEAGRAGIETTVDVSAPENLPFATIDLCALFANLMDNAMAANAEAESKKLSLRAGQRGAFYIVEMRNSCPPNATVPGESDKAKPGDEHGWGLQILEDIANRHAGVCEAFKEGDAFVTTVMLSTVGKN